MRVKLRYLLGLRGMRVVPYVGETVMYGIFTL